MPFLGDEDLEAWGQVLVDTMLKLKLQQESMGRHMIFVSPCYSKETVQVVWLFNVRVSHHPFSGKVPLDAFVHSKDATIMWKHNLGPMLHNYSVLVQQECANDYFTDFVKDAVYVK